MTWRLLERGVHVAHEPLAIVFVPEHATVTTVARGHAVRARAVRAAAAGNSVSALPQTSSRWVARLDLWSPVLDGIVALAWAQAVAFAVLGRLSLLVAVLVVAVPLSLVPVLLERRRHADTLEEAGLILVAPAEWLRYLFALDAVRGVLAVGSLRDGPITARRPPDAPNLAPAPVAAPPPPAPVAASLPPPAPALAPLPVRPRDARPVRRVRRLGGRARPYA